MSVHAKRDDGKYFQLGSFLTDDFDKRMVFSHKHHAQYAVTEMFTLGYRREHGVAPSKPDVVADFERWTFVSEEPPGG